MTVSWSAGYSTDIAYTLGFYRELSPTFLDYVCLAGGVAGLPARPIRYCELGCGRGYATVLLAAANPDGHFVGIDFNPTHIAEARSLAAETGVANVSFREMSFGEAADTADPELSELDAVAMHGVYSWVTPEVRGDIHRFLRRRLVAGGIFYASYNAMPGWAVVGPVQRLLQEAAARTTGDSLARFERGHALLRQLADAGSALVAQNPALKNRIAEMDRQDRRYLAHEFLNAGWQPLYATDAFAMLAAAKLDYVGSASLTENRLELAVPTAHREMVAGAPDAAMGELLKDYAVNKHFRRDVYVKGAQRLDPRQRRGRFEETAFLRLGGGARPASYRVPAGEATPRPEILAAVDEAFAAGPASGGELVSAGERAGGRAADIHALLDILIQHGLVHPARADHATVDRGPAQRLNARLFDAATTSDSHRCLAAPAIGSAVAADRLDRLMAPLVLSATPGTDEALARTALERLRAAGLSLKRDPGAGLPDDDAEALAKVADTFRRDRLPLWRVLGLLAG